MTTDDREQLEQQRDLLGARIRDGKALVKEIRAHRALSDFVNERIDRAALAQWLARIESGGA